MATAAAYSNTTPANTQASKILLDSNKCCIRIHKYGKGTTLYKETKEREKVYCITKESAAAWAGIILANTPVSNLQGFNINISFKMKVDEIAPIDNSSALFLSSIWFADKRNVTSFKKRISPKDLVKVTGKSGWGAYNYKIKVPAKAKFLNMVFCFGHSNGKAAISDIKISIDKITISRKHSPKFTNCILVAGKNTKQAEKSKLYFGNGPLQAEAALSFDEKYLYCMVKINDAVFFQPYHNENIWKADSIQVAFDTKFDRSRDRYNPQDDYEFGTALVNGKPYLHTFFQPPDFPMPVNSVDISTTRDDSSGKTIYKLRFPWQFLGPTRFKNINRQGFNILVNNSDGKKRSYIEWTGGIGSKKSPAAFGLMLLDKNGTGISAATIVDTTENYGSGNTDLNVFIASFRTAAVATEVKLNGSTVYSGKIQLTPGETKLNISIPYYCLKNGNNTVSIQLREANRIIIREQFSINKRAVELISVEINKHLKKATSKYEKLKKAISGITRHSGSPRELQVSLQVAKLFLFRYIREDLDDKRYKLAMREAEDLNQLLDNALEQVNRNNYLFFREKPVTNIKFDNGTLVCKGSAVFLLGHLYSNRIRHLNLLAQKNLGINFTVISGVTAHYFVPWNKKLKLNPEAGLIIEKKLLGERKKYNMAVSALLLTNQIPKWFGTLFPEAKVTGNHFFEYDPDNPKVKEFVEKATRHYFTRLKNEHPDLLQAVLFWDLANEPTIETISGLTLKNFREALKTKYKTISNLNRAWKTNFTSFTAIANIHSLFPVKPVCRYDWCIFNNERFYRFFKKSADVAKTVCPGQVKLSMKLMNGHSWLPKFRADNGYDRELLMKITDVNGADTAVAAGADGPYSIPWKIQSLSNDLCKSLAPDQPVVDSEYHAVPSSPEHMRAALWLGAWHGLNGASLWTLSRDKKLYFWKNGDGETWMKTAQDTMPLVMDIYGRTGIRIGNQMDRIRKFYEAERPIRLLYSQTALIYDGSSYLHALENSYQAFYFQNHSVGFIGERMLNTGTIPPELRLLIIPHAVHATDATVKALMALENKGVKILFIGSNNLTRDESDQARQVPKFKTAVRLPEMPLDKLLVKAPELMTKAGIKSEYILKTKTGKVPEYVEARFVKAHNATTAYAINLSKKTVTFKIYDSSDKVMQIKNIFKTKSAVSESITLAPLELINFNILNQ